MVEVNIFILQMCLLKLQNMKSVCVDTSLCLVSSLSKQRNRYILRMFFFRQAGTSLFYCCSLGFILHPQFVSVDLQALYETPCDLGYLEIYSKSDLLSREILKHGLVCLHKGPGRFLTWKLQGVYQIKCSSSFSYLSRFLLCASLSHFSSIFMVPKLCSEHRWHCNNRGHIQPIMQVPMTRLELIAFPK